MVVPAFTFAGAARARVSGRTWQVVRRRFGLRMHGCHVESRAALQNLSMWTTLPGLCALAGSGAHRRTFAVEPLNRHAKPDEDHR